MNIVKIIFQNTIGTKINFYLLKMKSSDIELLMNLNLLDFFINCTKGYRQKMKTKHLR